MLESLFRQFRTNVKSADGSRWLHLHGRLLIGTVQSKDLGPLHPDVIKSYYYSNKDRYPTDALMTETDWARDCQRADIRRRKETPYVGVYACLLSSITITAMLIGFSVIAGVGAVGGKIGSAVGLTPSFESCKAQYQKAMTSGDSTVNPKCEEVMEKAGQL
ncbi:hypothetical protein [Xanthomonas cannabis]|uniref:hypothetical protein n=1 Tax=Xanthomonas cannabis TaxID=1885674 RepID=UPI001112B209|nr:hypothetical protein [Xanthomonas cannabis]